MRLYNTLWEKCLQNRHFPRVVANELQTAVEHLRACLTFPGAAFYLWFKGR